MLARIDPTLVLSANTGEVWVLMLDGVYLNADGGPTFVPSPRLRCAGWGGAAGGRGNLVREPADSEASRSSTQASDRVSLVSRDNFVPCALTPGGSGTPMVGSCSEYTAVREDNSLGAN